MNTLLLLLSTVNDKGASVDKGTLEVILLLLAIVLVLLILFSRRWRR